MAKKNEVVEATDRGWSIGVKRTNSYSIIVNADNHPNYTSVELHDARVEDFRNLANMFSKIADELEKEEYLKKLGIKK